MLQVLFTVSCRLNAIYVLVQLGHARCMVTRVFQEYELCYKVAALSYLWSQHIVRIGLWPCHHVARASGWQSPACPLEHIGPWKSMAWRCHHPQEMGGVGPWHLMMGGSCVHQSWWHAEGWPWHWLPCYCSLLSCYLPYLMTNWVAGNRRPHK